MIVYELLEYLLKEGNNTDYGNGTLIVSGLIIFVPQKIDSRRVGGSLDQRVGDYQFSVYNTGIET